MPGLSLQPESIPNEMKVNVEIMITRTKKGWSWAICLATLIALLFPAAAWSQNPPKTMPELTLPSLNGDPVELNSFRGKTVLINFWATWCTPCLKEIPLFIGLHDRFQDKGFEVVGIDIWDDSDQARRFAAEKGMQYPILVGDDHAAEAFGGIQGLPATFLVDTQGRIVKTYFAVDENTFRALEKDVLELLDTGRLQSKTSDLSKISLLTAFLAGILSFLSPCVLPLIPSYVSFITGISHEEFVGTDVLSARARRTTLVHSILFVVGFSIIFILLGASATFVGGLFTSYRGILEKVVGVVIIIFGLHISGLINLKFLLMEKKFHMQTKPLGYLGTVLVGFSFGVGWTPCIGPILGSILGFAATIGNLGAGILLLSFYSLGLGIPFLISAVAIQSFFVTFKRIRRFIPVISTASGIFLVIVGGLIFSGYFVKLAVLFQGWMNAVFPWLGNLG